MPYVPPHQRSGAASASLSNVNANGSLPKSLDGHYSASGKSFGYSKDYQSNSNRRGGSSGSNLREVGNGNGSSHSHRQQTDARGSSIPEAVFPQWQPSERIRRFENDQIEEVRARLNVDVASGTPPASAPVESFEDMCLHVSIMKDIVFHEYTRPTPIQAQAMPVALSGRDLLGCAETGSGKTAAFAIPMIQHCLAQPPIRHGDGPLALVLAPTRELAQQIEKEVSTVESVGDHLSQNYQRKFTSSPARTSSPAATFWEHTRTFLIYNSAGITKNSPGVIRILSLYRCSQLNFLGECNEGNRCFAKDCLAEFLQSEKFSQAKVKAFSRSLESFRTAVVVGGTNIAEQRSELRAGVQIVVATPGRFIDHLQQGNSSLSRISFVVLDEADRMLDMGFEPQIREVMRNLSKHHQTLLFSATMPEEIEGLAQEYLNNPVQVKVGKVSSPTANVCQTLEKVTDGEKIDRLLALLVEESSQAEKSGQPQPLTIVFVERKTRCDEVTDALVAQDLHAVSLHGGRSQGDREAALREFRSGTTNILVATDVASRGLDVTGVAHVVNLDLPKAMEDYVHRIGRTGRAGTTGRATSFYTDRDMFLVAQVRKAISDAEAGNSMAFATGKAARRKEREQAAAFRDGRNSPAGMGLVGTNTIHVEDKYKYMLAQANLKQEGAADNAWDD